MGRTVDSISKITYCYLKIHLINWLPIDNTINSNVLTINNVHARRGNATNANNKNILRAQTINI